MHDLILGSAILLGLCIYFIPTIIGRFHRTEHTVSRPLELDTWSFDPELSDQSAIEQRDRWVLD